MLTANKIIKIKKLNISETDKEKHSCNIKQNISIKTIKIKNKTIKGRLWDKLFIKKTIKLVLS